MRILHINTYYKTGKFYKCLFDLQVKNNYDISVFMPDFEEKDKDRDFGDYTIVSKNHNKNDRFVFHYKQHKIYQDLLSKYDVDKFDLVHAHSIFTNGYSAYKLKKKYGIPYIIAVRNVDIYTFFKKMPFLKGLGVDIILNADHVIFLSEVYREDVLNRFIPDNKKQWIKDNSSVITNGVDAFWFENKNSEIKTKPVETLNLIAVGDINRNKNVLTTVKAVRLLQEKGYQVKLDVVGRVKDQTVFDQIKDLDFVNYLGFVSKEELIGIYRKNDIFVMPSLHETFGLVYAEAMTQGLPVIYTKDQGFDGQFTEGEVGYAVNALNEKEISERIVEILDDYDNISIKCLNNANKYQWSGLEKRYQDIYQDIAG